MNTIRKATRDHVTDSDTGLIIASNATPDSNAPRWHAAIRRYAFGPRTGKVLSSSLVAKCSGRSLGGAYGHTTRHAGEMGEWDNPCRRCAAILANERTAFQSRARAWFALTGPASWVREVEENGLGRRLPSSADASARAVAAELGAA